MKGLYGWIKIRKHPPAHWVTAHTTHTHDTYTQLGSYSHARINESHVFIRFSENL